MEREIRILPDGAAIARRAAQEFVQAAAPAVREKGSFNLALAGGSTPKALYSLLVDDPTLRSQVPWDKIHLFFGDERHVPPDHPDSNFRMATEAMISKAPLKPEQVTRIKGEYPDAEQAAREYEKALREYFKLKDGEYPGFDLVLAGMGNEGHTLCGCEKLGGQAVHGTHHAHCAGCQQRRANHLHGDGRRQSRRTESRAGRAVRAGTIARAIDPAKKRKTALAGRYCRRRHAFDRNSRIVDRFTVTPDLTAWQSRLNRPPGGRT